MENFFKIIIECVYFILPALIGNGMNVICSHFKTISWLDQPIDRGKKWRRKEIFGKNKTYRGFVVAIIFGMLTAQVQLSLYVFESFHNISIFDYTNVNPILFGGVMAFGGMFGDLIKSFFKRRFGIQSGKPWPIFDQIDLPLGALLFSLPFYIPSFPYILGALIGGGLAQFLSDVVAYFLRIKRMWW